LILRVLERQRICKFGALIQVGGKSLHTEVNTSAISKNLIDALMLSKERMRKAQLSKFITDTTEPTKDGRFFILTKRQRLRPRV
jgi:hypothetical protein